MIKKRNKKQKPLDIRITWLFKKWIVRRPKGMCQVLFSLTELDNLVEEIMAEVNNYEKRKQKRISKCTLYNK